MAINMVKKAFLLALTLIITSSCVTGPKGFLKKSANGKYFDSKGFHGGKRQPLHNRKYINLAKKNISNDHLSEEAYEEYDDEKENIVQDNINQYIKLMKAEEEFKDKRKGSTGKRIYPSLIKASTRIDPNTHTNNLKMKEELIQVREMLAKTQIELKKQNELLLQKKKYEAAQEKKAKMKPEMQKKPMQKEIMQNDLLLQKKKYEAAQEKKAKMKLEMQKQEQKQPPKKQIKKQPQKSEMKKKVTTDSKSSVAPLPSAAKSTEIIEPKRNIQSL